MLPSFLFVFYLVMNSFSKGGFALALGIVAIAYAQDYFNLGLNRTLEEQTT